MVKSKHTPLDLFQKWDLIKVLTYIFFITVHKKRIISLKPKKCLIRTPTNGNLPDGLFTKISPKHIGSQNSKKIFTIIPLTKHLPNQEEMKKVYGGIYAKDGIYAARLSLMIILIMNVTISKQSVAVRATVPSVEDGEVVLRIIYSILIPNLRSYLKILSVITVYGKKKAVMNQ